MKLYLLTFMFSAIALGCKAQNTEFTDKVLDKMVLEINLGGSEMFSKEIQQELNLSEEQYQKIESLNKWRFQQVLKAEEKFAGDSVLLNRTVKEIHTDSDKALTSVLTDEQLIQYRKLAGKKQKLYYSINQHE